MTITREALVARKEELQASLEQLKAQHQAISGALADTEFWLSRFDEEPEQKED
ncbi:MAG: hypothetical protein LC723_13465 [Actinobacteria bacterium]|nr:hypothetical protein [Actinomycetota bacterium]